MKKLIKVMSFSLLAIALLAGCSSNDTSDMSDGEANKSTEKAKESATKTVDDSIDNVMTFFKDKKIEIENSQPIENMEFAAHEGRSFMVNGSNAYLYRVKEDDENMKKVMNEAKDKGKVKVNINNEEMEYNALVNGSYLLLSDPAGNMNDLTTTFPSYVVQTPNNAGNNLDSTNPSTLNPSEGNSESADPSKDNSSTNENLNGNEMSSSKSTTGNNENSTNNNTTSMMENED